MDTSRATDWFQREIGLKFGDLDINAAVAVVADDNAHSSARDWFDSLVWDGEPRLDRWLVRYLGAEDTEYHRLVGRWWLISAVARVYQPGCKADHVLVLEGPQGIGKSSALRTLAGPHWFSDTSIDLQSKDAFAALRGRLIVEMPELDTLRRADEHRAKAFFSSPVDSYRPPYARYSVTVPRQTVFAATTNQDGWLKDDTGNRRYWPVRCVSADLGALAADRASIWAEARESFRAGAAWWPSADEQAIAGVEQDARYQSDDWQDVVSQWMRANAITETTSADVLERALKLPIGQWGRLEQMRAASVLRKLGWVPYRSASGAGHRPRQWRAPRSWQIGQSDQDRDDEISPPALKF